MYLAHNKNNKQMKAVFLILNLVLAIFAFNGLISADTTADTTTIPTGTTTTTTTGTGDTETGDTTTTPDTDVKIGDDDNRYSS